MTIKEAVEDIFNMRGDYREMTLDDIALEITDKIVDFKDANVDTLRRKISSFMANETTKVVNGERVEDKNSKYQRVPNGRGGFKKGVYKLRRPRVVRPRPIQRPDDPILVQGNNNDISERSYIGSAGEMAVCSELLFRGYNISRMAVDDGVDIVAIKNSKTFYIQVKTTHVTSTNFSAPPIRKKSFEKYNGNDCYYIVVARTSTKNGLPINQFIVLSAQHIEYMIGCGYVKDSNGSISIPFTQNDGNISVRDFNIKPMLNNFELIK